MRTQTLGRSSLVSSRLAYGAMRISGSWDPAKVTPAMEQAGILALLTAWEAGYTLIDHADIYGQTYCETIHGKALKLHPELKKAVVATKCGIRFAGDPTPAAPHRYDFSYEHIVWSCEQSLKRLGVECIDLYQLHRPDFLADPSDIIKAFVKLKHEGKVKEFGVSNFRPAVLSMLQAHCPMHLIVNQVEIHSARLDCFTDGTLDQCLEKEITPLAWSPLAGGLLGDGGNVDAKDPRATLLHKLLQVLDELAQAHGVSRTVLSLAWLLKHPSKIIPIVGSVKPERIKDAVKADSVELSREEWYSVLLAARGEALP
jgi:predicted oxidoreductase